METKDLLSVFREEVDDTVEEYFWSDNLFYYYLTDAINQYCITGNPIRDHTSSLTLVDYVADEPWINLDERILKIISAYDESGNTKLRILDWETFEQRGTDRQTSDYNAFLTVTRYPDSTGSVYSLITGMDDNRLRVVNIPSVDGTIKLVIDRLPINIIDRDNQKIEGVPIHDRLKLLDWVKYKAYSNQDAEQFDPEKAATSRLLFEQSMLQVDSVNHKRVHKPKYASYGGI